MHVKCDILDWIVDTKDRRDVDGVLVQCQRCYHTAQAAGRSRGSVRLCFKQLRETCPNDGHNFYEPAEWPWWCQEKVR